MQRFTTSKLLDFTLPKLPTTLTCLGLGVVIASYTVKSVCKQTLIVCLVIGLVPGIILGGVFLLALSVLLRVLYVALEAAERRRHKKDI